MTTRAVRPAVPQRTYPQRWFGVGAIVDKMRTTDPRVIGLMYAVSTFVFFVIGGLLALLMRAGLAPGMQLRLPRAVQPVVHHPRDHHAADLCHTGGAQVCEFRAAGADRFPRRCFPPVE